MGLHMFTIQTTFRFHQQTTPKITIQGTFHNKTCIRYKKRFNEKYFQWKIIYYNYATNNIFKSLNYIFKTENSNQDIDTKMFY